MAEKKVEDLNQALTLLGHASAQLPPDADVGSLTSEQPEQGSSLPAPEESGEPQTPLATESVEEPTSEPSTTEESTEPEPEPKEETLTWEERAKRHQSRADRAEHQLKMIQQENEALKSRIQELTGVVQTLQQFMSKYGMNAPQVEGKSQETVEEDSKPPRLEDFIDEDYDPADAFDLRTKSGKAYHRWLEARERWLVEQAEKRAARKVEEKLKTETQMESVRRRAQRLAEKYPEFRDPLTGEPDYNKIQNWIVQVSQNQGDDEWVLFKEFQDFKAGKFKPSIEEETVKKIEEQASKPSSVSAATQAAPKPRTVPKEYEDLIKVFGRIELPPELGK